MLRHYKGFYIIQPDQEGIMNGRCWIRQNLFLFIGLIGYLSACSLFDPGLLPTHTAQALHPTSTVTVISSSTPTLTHEPTSEILIPETDTPTPQPSLQKFAVQELSCQSQDFSAQGPWFICEEGSFDSRSISIISIDGKACSNLEVPAETGPIRFYALSPTGLHLALGIDNLDSQHLEQIWIAQLPQLVVLEKIDMLSAETREMIASYTPPEESFDPLDYSHPIQLALQAAADKLMQWSPDGRFLAYVSASDGTSVDVYTYDTEENQTNRLTSGPTQAVLYGWSPDSEWIVHQGATKFTEYGIWYDQAWAVSALTGQMVSFDERSFGYKILGWVSEDTFLVEGYGGFEISLDELALVSIRESSCESIAILPSNDEIYDPEHEVLVLESSIWSDIEKGVFVQSPITASPVRILTGDYYIHTYHPELDLFSATDPQNDLVLFTSSGEIKLKIPGARSIFPSPDGQYILVDRTALMTSTGDVLVNLEGSQSTAWTQDYSALVTEYKDTFYLLSQSNEWKPQEILKLPNALSCTFLEPLQP